MELAYRLAWPDDATPVELVEVVEFPFDLPAGPAVDVAVRVLHLVAGVSYYKCVAPAPLQIPTATAAEERLLEGLYDQGLREFAYRNGFRVPLPVELRVGESLPSGAGGVGGAGGDGAPGSAGSLVPIGGGKDSALVASLVPDGVLFAVNPVGAHEHLAEAMGRPLVRVRRTLDPRLRDLVAAGAPNGHVPVTAITSAISVLGALGLGVRDVLMGIERSADEPSLITADGVPVNHQYSKSTEAEGLLRAVFEPTGVRYLSLLRPMSELAIGAAVARRGLARDIVSCNRVFTTWNPTRASEEQRPCGTCAKCLFTALMVAPASEPAEVAERYGRALLDEADHVEAVRQLWSDEKPFDCVGERLEAAAAVVLLGRAPAWADQVVVRALAGEAADLLAVEGVEPVEFLRLGGLADLPADLQPVVAAVEPDLAVAAGLLDAPR